MTDYTYSRGWDGDRYHVENVERVSGEDHIYLSKEIEAALPGKIFRIFGADDVLTCVFDEALTTLEETTLDTVVYDHKNNTQ